MKKKELEKIGKQLLPDLSGFMVKGDLLFVQPIGHTLRGICFDRSIDPRGFYAHVFVQPLFIPVPPDVIVLSFGWRIHGGCLWNGDDPKLITELGSAIRREAIPFLSRIKSPHDVAEVGLSLHLSGSQYVQKAIAYSLARSGEVDRACAELDKLVNLIYSTWHTGNAPPWALEGVAKAEALRRELLASPDEAQRQLARWEKETAENLGLDKYV